MQIKAVNLLATSLRVLPVALATLLVSCGGGSGTAAPTDGPLSISTATDTLTTAFAGTGGGYWDGAGGDGGGGGGADGGGGAGDGEFVQFHIDFGTLKFSWTVLRSEYGIAGQTGSLNLVKDLSNGGYKAIGTGAEQANIFVSKAGQVTGSIPLVVGGSTVYMTYNAMRYKDAVTNFNQVAGTYVLVAIIRSVNTGANPETTVGTININNDGTGRFCPESGYSDTCNNGFPVTVGFDDPANPKLIKVTSSDAHALIGYGVTRTNDQNVQTAFLDISFTDNSLGRRTGNVAMAKLSTINFNPANFTGAWYYAAIDTGSTSRSMGTGQASFNGTTYKTLDSGGSTTCNSSNPAFDQGTIGNASTYESTFTSAGYLFSAFPGGNPSPAIMIPISTDLLAIARSGTTTPGDHGNYALLRRYNTNPGVAPCP